MKHAELITRLLTVLLLLWASVACAAEATASCPDSTDAQVGEQTDYLGIVPGKTTEDELIEIADLPIQTYPALPGEYWEYMEENSGDEYVVTLQNNVVHELRKESSDSPNVEEIVEQYGCPDAIFAVEIGEHQTGNYNSTRLAYLDRGLTFYFPDYPLLLSHQPATITYFSPVSLEDYISKEHPSLAAPGRASQISWDEAVN